MKRVCLLAAVALACLPAFVGCSDDGPPTVRYGHEECGYCRMIVNDDRFAAAAVTPGGEAKKFDDISCLVEYAGENPGVTALWVRGYRSGQWHKAREVYFAYGPKLQTPMGAGLAVVPTKAEADQLAAEWGGKVLRFDELAEFLMNKD
jgi:copper chaperone NosL